MFQLKFCIITPSIFLILNTKVIFGESDFPSFINKITKSNSISKNYLDVFNNSQKINNFDLNRKINPDSFLTTYQLIRKYGYEGETHTVQTQDGYILELHRIKKEGGIPVLLMHGLLDSSSTWIIMGPGKGLAYILSDLGYDVWMGNVRGNRYSKKHIKYKTNDSKFWQFSFHEMGKYDVPSIIDYILEKTKFEKLHYIGHSQGTTIFWILCSEHPEYNNKILSMNALGPAAYLKNAKSPVAKFMAKNLNPISKLLKLIGVDEFMPNHDFFKIFALTCNDNLFGEMMCSNIIFLMVGYNEQKLNKTMLPVICSHCPAGAATKQMIHFGQLVNSGYFRQYDYGLIENLKIYHKRTPPNYNLSNVKAKVFLHYSLNDWLTVPEDVRKLQKELPNVKGAYLAQDHNYNHLDFLWATDVKTIIYDNIIQILQTNN